MSFLIGKSDRAEFVDTPIDRKVAHSMLCGVIVGAAAPYQVNAMVSKKIAQSHRGLAGHGDRAGTVNGRQHA